MKLNTFISEQAWLTLLDQGFLICDNPALASPRGWLFAYEWMTEQMTLRIGPPTDGAVLPLWAWKKYYGGRRKALTTGWRDEAGKRLYRLDFEIDEGRVLLSDFTDWHSVLNDCYIGTTLAEYEAYEMMFEVPKSTPALEANATTVKRKSWETIFDLQLKKVFGDRVEKRECIQACLWKIELSQVTKVQSYLSNGYKFRTIKPRLRRSQDKIHIGPTRMG